LRARLAATGIGYAGIDGAWWLPAAEPLVLPQALGAHLDAVADAVFVLLDCVRTLYASGQGRDAGLDQLLEYKVPRRLLACASPEAVLSLRPDFQLVADASGTIVDVAATELEICPAAHGFAHAMQVAAGLSADLADAVADLLAGRTLMIVGSEQWSEFLIEQLAFCRALDERGARARVFYDRALDRMDAEFRRGERWKPPMFGVDVEPPGWRTELCTRLDVAGLRRYWVDEWPQQLDGNTVFFRFGYLECFAPDDWVRMIEWEKGGASALNPTHFAWENKAVMAALRLPAVRNMIADAQPNALAILDRAIPETLLVEPGCIERLVDEQAQWIIKFAGFDGGNLAWGGRSLQVGAALGREAWRSALAAAVSLDFPVVAQRLTPSQPMTVRHIGSVQTPAGSLSGPTRLRSFFLRSSPGARARAVGSHVTVSPSGGGVRVSEALESVQAPVLFAGQPR